MTGAFTIPADANPATLQVYIGTGAEPGATYSYLVDDILVTTEDDGGRSTGPTACSRSRS